MYPPPKDRCLKSLKGYTKMIKPLVLLTWVMSGPLSGSQDASWPWQAASVRFTKKRNAKAKERNMFSFQNILTATTTSRAISYFWFVFVFAPNELKFAFSRFWRNGEVWRETIWVQILKKLDFWVDRKNNMCAEMRHSLDGEMGI